MKRIRYWFDGEEFWYTLTVHESQVFDFLINAGSTEVSIVKYFEENARKEFEQTKMLESNPDIFKRSFI
mgnify:CR=1 FL=1